MGKVETGIYLLSHCRYFDKSCTEMFLEESATNHMNVVQTAEFDWLPWQPNLQKNLLLRSQKGDEAETCRNVHNTSLYKVYVFLLLLLMCFHCYGNLKFPLTYTEKSESSTYCYLTADILTECFEKCLISKPPPSIKKLFKFLIFICCHDNWKSKVLN